MVLGDNRQLDKSHVGVVCIGEQAKELYMFFFRSPLDTSMFENVMVRSSHFLYRKVMTLSHIRRLYVLKNNASIKHIVRLGENGKLLESTHVDLQKLSTACPNLINLFKSVKTPHDSEQEEPQ